MAIIKNATFETNTDNHVSWFSSTVARDSGNAHGGTWSLLVTQTDAFAGVQLDNFPYYPGITAGNNYDFQLWYIEQTATMPTVTWQINWYDNAGTGVGTASTISMPRATSWTLATSTVTAPTGALRVGWTFATSAGNGSAWRIDDLLVQDSAPAASLILPVVRSNRTVA